MNTLPIARAEHPTWIRPPKRGALDFWTGLSPQKLYQLAESGKIRTASLKEPGQKRAVRLYHLQSIFDFLNDRAK
jgi:hypothetical protein